jgi:hypothetical protein
MPTIKEYNTPALGLRPNETGISATAAAARRVGAEYNEAGSSIAAGGQAIAHAGKIAGDMYVDYLDHQEISRGAPAFAGLMSSKTDEWNKVANDSDPNDPTVAQKFVEENLNPALDKFKEGFTTEKSQQWAESHIDAFRQHMFTKTSADMASNAGRAAEVNVRQTINAMSNTVRNDPTSLDFTLQTYESSLNGMVDSSPNLKNTEGGKIKTALMQHGQEEIVKSAVLGHIEKTGEIPDWVNKSEYSKYINGAELKQFEQAAKNYNRLNNAEGRAQRVQRDYEAKSDFNRRVNELEVSTAPKNQGDPPQLPADYWDNIRDLAKHPGAALEPGRLKTMIENGERITARLNKPEPLGPDSRLTTIDLVQRMRSEGPDRLKSDNDIYAAYMDGKLTNADFNFLRKEWVDNKTVTGEAMNHERSEFFKRYEGFIDPQAQMGVRTPDGQARMYQAEVAARRMEEMARAAGKSPHEVYDPDSPWYFGRPANLLKFGPKTLQQQALEKAQAKQPPTITGDAFKDRFGTMTVPTVPPPDKREKDKVYMTPKGALKWTGTGWVQ